MGEINSDVILRLRDMARRGDSPAAMFNEVKRLLGPDAHILTILGHMRAAFCLRLAEAEPFAALSRTDQRKIVDEALLDERVLSEIAKRQSEWDA
jgi:hypothetical protein